MRDTIARQSDVDKNSLQYEVEPGQADYRNATITFYAKAGQSIDLQKLHESIQATRLSGNTRSALNYLEITVQGEVVVVEKDTLVLVTGTTQQLTLGDAPDAKPHDGGQTPFQQLCEALNRAEKVATVTGRVHGWSGPWPLVLRALPGDPAPEPGEPDESGAGKRLLLIVTGFQTAKEQKTL